MKPLVLAIILSLTIGCAANKELLRIEKESIERDAMIAKFLGELVDVYNLHIDTLHGSIKQQTKINP